MDATADWFRRDHREIEALLSILERECDLFRLAGQPDYELLKEIIDYLRSFLEEYYHPKENIVFNLTSVKSPRCDNVISNIAAERAAAATSLQALEASLQDILNDRQVLRQAFYDAAHDFIQHERRQFQIEEQQLFPEILAILTPEEWAKIVAEIEDQRASLRSHGLEERLRARHRWINREALADQVERGPASGAFKA